jgi:RNA polymerase sigma-70 factor (ECF subfamily)
MSLTLFGNAAAPPPSSPGQPGGRTSPSKGTGDVKRTGSRDDLALVDRCRGGDSAAFEELYRQHAGRLFNLAFRMAGPQAAEDLLQDIFLLAYRKLATFRGDSSLATWLYRLAMNHCLDHLRGRQAQMGKVTASLDEEDAAEPADSVALQTPLTRMELERAIELLPPGCRAAFLLHDVEGFEHKEIGQILEISEGTSKSQVHKARMKLRQTLGRR